MIEAVLLGVLAGLAAGLLGIGGGALFVPALTLFLGLTQLEATATSLLAIVLIAAVAVGVHALYGNVHVAEGLLVGIPAVSGVLAGTWLQQRVPERAVSLVFAGVLLLAAADLVVGG